MKTTPFYEAAIKYAKLMPPHGINKKWLKKREYEWMDALYRDRPKYWKLSEHSMEFIHNYRIISLLFADLMWRDEHETNNKSKRNKYGQFTV